MDERRWLTFDLFAERLGEPFTVTVAGHEPLVLRLADARESAQPAGPGPDGQDRLQFAVELRGPRDPLLGQATYELHHADLGRLVLFLVPVARDDEGTTYEAAFA